jgi:hypothetical protein
MQLISPPYQPQETFCSPNRAGIAFFSGNVRASDIISCFIQGETEGEMSFQMLCKRARPTEELQDVAKG